jgi:hypothetical protein
MMSDARKFVEKQEILFKAKLKSSNNYDRDGLKTEHRLHHSIQKHQSCKRCGQSRVLSGISLDDA